jgi:hypothetical protein
MRFLRFDCRDNRPDSVFFEEEAKRIGVTSLVAHQPGIRGDKLTQVSATTQSSVFRGGSTHIYISDRLWQRVSPAPLLHSLLAQRWALTCCQVAQAYREAARWLALIGKGPRRSMRPAQRSREIPLRGSTPPRGLLENSSVWCERSIDLVQ